MASAPGCRRDVFPSSAYEARRGPRLISCEQCSADLFPAPALFQAASLIKGVSPIMSPNIDYVDDDDSAVDKWAVQHDSEQSKCFGD